MIDLHETINTIEERLLGTWTRRPGLRAAWIPEPAEFFGVRAQAVAAACGAVADLSGNDLGTAVVVALSAAGKLKLWGHGRWCLTRTYRTRSRRWTSGASCEA
jgi:hypothetical protein